MSHLSPIWSVLLISGFFLMDTCTKASPTAEPILLLNPTAPNTTTHAPSNTTTHAPSNTTTHAPSNTTTHAPSNTTTHAPSNTTTHAPSNTTTHAPSNTTTHAPTNTTTHVPTNTTAHTTATPTPTPTLAPRPSPPESGNYTLKNKTVTCVAAQMGLELELENSSKKKSYFNIEPNKTITNGTCGDNKVDLILKFPEGTIHFVFVKESKVYYIDEVTVNFYLASAGYWNGTARKQNLLKTDVGYSVKCKNTPTVNVADNIQLVMSNVKLQAFDINDGVFGKEEMCTYDRNVVAVAIAVTVIIIVIVAIVIYFIWHKRRSSGYQRI